MTSFEESLQEDETWLEFLDKTEKGFIKAHVRNVILALRNAKKLQGLIRQNKFKNCIEIARDPPWASLSVPRLWTDNDDTQLMAYLQSYEMNVKSIQTIGQAVAVVAQERSFHPVKAYLNSLQWDGINRLDTWLHGVGFGREFSRSPSARWE